MAAIAGMAIAVGTIIADMPMDMSASNTVTTAGATCTDTATPIADSVAVKLFAEARPMAVAASMVADADKHHLY